MAISTRYSTIKQREISKKLHLGGYCGWFFTVLCSVFLNIEVIGSFFGPDEKFTYLFIFINLKVAFPSPRIRIVPKMGSDPIWSWYSDFSNSNLCGSATLSTIRVSGVEIDWNFQKFGLKWRENLSRSGGSHIPVVFPGLERFSDGYFPRFQVNSQGGVSR